MLDHEGIMHLSGYVMQDDLLFDRLTVEEVLMFGARMRMHPAATAADHQRRVNKLLGIMELEECRKVIVGSPLLKGISGGQRKRLCVALELLARPSVLFLDEPTSGLDSVTALSLLHILRGIAHKENVTVVTTIHQPSRRIFDLFDDLLILDHGEAVYHGLASELHVFFDKAGFPCPESMNPTEWALTVISKEEGRNRIMRENCTPDALFERMLQSEMPVSIINEPIVQVEKAELSWFRKYSVLLGRSMKLESRSLFLIGVQLVQTIIMGVLIGTVFLFLPLTQANITNRRASIFFCAINQGYFGALLMVNVLPAERLVIMRERLSGWYPASAYVLAKATTELVFQSAYPVIFTLLVYWLIGYTATAGQFFIFVAFMLLCTLVANSIALLVSAATGRIILAAAALPLAMEVARLFGAYYVPPISLPKYFSWLEAISYITYVYMGTVQSQFIGLEFGGCANSTNSTVANSTSSCLNGDQVLASLGIGEVPIYACALVLIGMILVMRACAFLVLKVRP